MKYFFILVVKLNLLDGTEQIVVVKAHIYYLKGAFAVVRMINVRRKDKNRIFAAFVFFSFAFRYKIPVQNIIELEAMMIMRRNNNLIMGEKFML